MSIELEVIKLSPRKAHDLDAGGREERVVERTGPNNEVNGAAIDAGDPAS